MTLTYCDTRDSWIQFLEYVKQHCSPTAFDNWLAPIKVVEGSSEKLLLEVPNIFVKSYLLDNYKKDLCAFLPLDAVGEPAIDFVVADPGVRRQAGAPSSPSERVVSPLAAETDKLRLNPSYRFDNFIEGPSNQFVKSAAMGIALRPARSYNPLFIHGGVGMGKTHLLHAIGHYILENYKKLRIQCITTEAFINDLIFSWENKKSYDRKQYYRNLDVFLVDDIQFLQSRPNFQEEFSNTFESLINENKQIVIVSDKPPNQLKLSERIVARMEWGLVTHIGIPDLETRVAILQHKASQKGLHIPQNVAFFIAEHVFANVRQLEGAINRLAAHCRLLGQGLTESLVEQALGELFQPSATHKVSVENILKSVATVFEVRITDLKGTSRTKEVALARQVAMYLAKELMQEPLVTLAQSFSKSHSTLLHGWKTIAQRIKEDERLRRLVALCRRHID